MIKVQDLAKYFGGTRALGPVSFEIADGECVGFLGLNGAGKTTALRILACDLRPSAGEVRIGAVDALRDPHEVRKQVGFLPETPPVYGDMTVRDYLKFAGKLRGMNASELRRRVPEVEALTHLDTVSNNLIRTLSHGYRQRVGVAQAIVHQPRLLILDEPTRGLDPVQIVEMRNMIRTLKKHYTVLVSSHVLTEISETCDRLLVLGAGSIVGRGTEEELSADLLKTNRVVVAVKPAAGADADAVAKTLRAIDGVAEVATTGSSDGAQQFQIIATGEVRAAVCRALVQAGHDVIKLDRVERQLESIFLQLVHGGEGARN
jgi:ABC-2 type transport system ATP-binding protein